MSDDTPNPKHDSEDQRRLRALGRKLARRLQDAGAGGAILMASRDSTAWTFVLPPWSGIQHEGVGFRIRLSSKTPQGAADADATLHLITSLHELCTEAAEVYGKIRSALVAEIEAGGGTVEHKPQGSPGRIGPTGKIKN